MAKRLNGRLKVYIALSLIAAGVIASYAVLGRDVTEMKPAVKLNTEHRISDEAQDAAIQHKLDNILDIVTRE